MSLDGTSPTLSVSFYIFFESEPGSSNMRNMLLLNVWILKSLNEGNEWAVSMFQCLIVGNNGMFAIIEREQRDSTWIQHFKLN